MQIHSVDPDALHRMGQDESTKTTPAFVHVGIPEGGMLQDSSLPRGQHADGTNKLQAHLEAPNVVNTAGASVTPMERTNG